MLRFSYDRVVAFHPYRTMQPWENGGTRILQVDGVNGYEDEARLVRGMLRDLELRLLQGCRDAGIRCHEDNHYGFTVADDSEAQSVYYQLRFSDGSLYVWLMPGPPGS